MLHFGYAPGDMYSIYYVRYICLHVCNKYFDDIHTTHGIEKKKGSKSSTRAWNYKSRHDQIQNGDFPRQIKSFTLMKYLYCLVFYRGERVQAPMINSDLSK